MNTDTLKQIILDHITNKARFRYFPVRYPEVFQEIFDRTDFLPENSPISVRTYCILNDIEQNPKCIECGEGTTTYNKNVRQFRDFCSRRCMIKNHANDIQQHMSEIVEGVVRSAIHAAAKNEQIANRIAIQLKQNYSVKEAFELIGVDYGKYKKFVDGLASDLKSEVSKNSNMKLTPAAKTIKDMPELPGIKIYSDENDALFNVVFVVKHFDEVEATKFPIPSGKGIRKSIKGKNLKAKDLLNSLK